MNTSIIYLLGLACSSSLPQDSQSQDSAVQDSDTDTGLVDDTGDTGEGPTGSEAWCAPLAAPSGQIVEVGPDDDLEAVLEGLPAGATALLAAGTYTLNSESYIRLVEDGVRIQGATGNAEDVVIDGNWEAGFGLSIQASDVVVSDLTLQRFYYHPIHVTPGSGRSIEGVQIYRVRVIDGAEQAIKINTGGDGSLFSDSGSIACSHLELTDAGRAQVRNNCYTGGVDAHQARGWEIRDNRIEGFWCESGLSEHGVHFWRGGRDTQVFRNVLVNNARGIGFGLGSDDVGRRYDDAPCGGEIAQSYGEVAVNNLVFADSDALFASSSGFDVGIALESACQATVVHNTVYSTQAPYSSIEYRWPLSSGVIANNLVSHNVRDRGAGEIQLSANLDEAPADWFVDAAGLDLHLAAGAGAIDAGDASHGVAEDADGVERGISPDVGALEY
ncbi:MAG: hypothetical protein ACI9VR_002065 [Cognaticolwellia sp.]|jgi:hypothetical protein